ncbi:hypothetical protein [Acetonema longum]|uniref:Uncharacterized protein n=1 Tax=Acetonema longum DSM 6540 TaxID=1009370 RepID=F7NJM5_9FIRM|nr:hypothetical protein [Acetonema longum]EGO63756.1 hypothetical protein ALO_11414 [Acetonema longum DSM 6540]
MGAYNTLKVCRQCDKCQRDIQLIIQFKYGDTWQYEYEIGDNLKWGGHDIGIKGAKKVILDGVAKECPFCKAELDYIIHLENDKIISIELNKGQYDFRNSNGYYLIIEK